MVMPWCGRRMVRSAHGAVSAWCGRRMVQSAHGAHGVVGARCGRRMVRRGPTGAGCEALMSSFWVEKGGREHRDNMCIFSAELYGPGLKTRLR